MDMLDKYMPTNDFETTLETRAVIEKWYEILEFPKIYDAEFYNALKNIYISDKATLAKYNLKCEDGATNLLSYLYFCEETAEKYRELGIPEDILIATLKDIPTWTVEWSNIKNELYLGEISWLYLHLNVKIFRLGRLQFCMAKSGYDIQKYNIKKGDNIIEVHIPSSGGKLVSDAVGASLDMARNFFAKYFPDFEYSYFTCNSWLLDEKLKLYIGQNSNICRFGDMFDKVDKNKSNKLIRYLFRWDTTEENLKYVACNSAFSEKIKKAVLSGEQFYQTLGVIKK